MNTNIEEKIKDNPINTAIAEALFKNKKKKEEGKDSVDLLGITKKLSEKKFGKKKN